MKARHALAGSIIDPARRQITQDAFEAAWEIVKPAATKDTLANDRCRMRLAEILLSLQTDNLDVVQLRDRAVQAYLVATKPGQSLQ